MGEILVIHPGALGDVLQAVPALRALGEGGRVSLAAQGRIGELLAGTCVVHAALDFDTLGLAALFNEAPLPEALRSRLGRFERAVSWFGSRDPVYGRRLRALIPEAVVAPPVPEGDQTAPVWRHLFESVAAEGTGQPRLDPLPIPLAWQRLADQALGEIGLLRREPILVVHPGAGGAWKRWPAEAFAQVIRHVRARAGCRVLLHQGPADREAVDRVATTLELPLPRLIEPPLPCLAAVLAEAAAYLGGDSGVSHLAASVGAPGVMLFPAATRERWAPWSPTARPVATDEPAAAPEPVAGILVEALGRRGRPGGPPACTAA